MARVVVRRFFLFAVFAYVDKHCVLADFFDLRKGNELFSLAESETLSARYGEALDFALGKGKSQIAYLAQILAVGKIYHIFLFEFFKFNFHL